MAHLYDVGIPCLKITVVQTDGVNVEPVSVDEFRFGPGQTYNVIVQPKDDAYHAVCAIDGAHRLRPRHFINPAQVTRTVEVVMDDNMRFTPANINVKAGETIRFFVKSAGKLQHEMVLGELKELKAHAEMMRSMPTMQHEEPKMVNLKPGQRGGIVWQFTQAGMVDFACTIPGHMESGTLGTVAVSQ